MVDLKIDGFVYADLYDPARLRELAEKFYAEVASADPDLGKRYAEYRDGAQLGPVDESTLLIDVARHLSDFVARLFGICLLYTSPSPRDKRQSRMPSSA